MVTRRGIKIISPPISLFMVKLQIKYRDKFFYFNHYFGLLVSYFKSKGNTSANICDPKIQRYINLINNPFLVCTTYPKKINNKNTKKWIRYYALFLMWLNKHIPAILFRLTFLKLNVFDNAIEAADYFCSLNPSEQDRLCLPRSIFSMTTSKEFKSNGVFIVGIFLPSKHLHAWVMENDKNTFRYDNIWINYSPLLIIS